MKRALWGLVLSFSFVAGCKTTSLTSSNCEKAVENVMAKCGTCFGTSSAGTSSRDSASCKQALLNMCGTGSASSSASLSSSSVSPEAFLACVANATSCDGILLCK